MKQNAQNNENKCFNALTKLVESKDVDTASLESFVSAHQNDKSEYDKA